MKVTKETIIGDVLDYDSGTAKFFLEIGMHALVARPQEVNLLKTHVLFTAQTLMNS